MFYLPRSTSELSLDELAYEPTTPVLSAGSKSKDSPYEVLFGADVFSGLDFDDEGILDEDE